MIFSTLSVLALVSASFAAPAPVTTDEYVRAPTGFNITSVGVIGTGCPPGTSYALVSDDNSALTAVFSQFYAFAGPGVGISDNRKACRLTLGVKVPEGYSFSVNTLEHAGFYQLDKGVTGSQGSYYYFQGEINEATARKAYEGPVLGKDYINKIDFEGAAFSPCGKDTVLNFGSDVRVNNANNKNGYGAIGTDSIQFRQTLHLSWKAC
ncbi:hypothetical protein EST38_g10227 [Candolleomyces aberdarensis]|uniref:Secreted protein n=1 Tax=Candolleomyces aberdarensis TaxID=2316362 RepID=A0A4Q2D8L4_9AGAR|nr:hypothetical protein EST38_g10227 [Candolleomyces aberdarensis]